MLSMKDMKVRTKLQFLVGISVLGLLVFGGLSYLTISKVKVGGPVHQEMLMYSDLNGDIAPPALDMERVRMPVIKAMIDSKDKVPEDLAAYQQRKKEFEDATSSWAKRLPESKIKELATVEAYNQGKKYMDIAEQEIFPALQRGDLKAALAARNRAVPFSDASGAATRQAVELLQAEQAKLDQESAETVRNRLLLLFGLCAVVGVVVAAMGLTTGSSVSSATLGALHFANAIAAGKLNESEMQVNGQDEFAELGTALNKMNASLKLLNADFVGQINAIKKSQAVVEFNLDGTILTANDNFLRTMSYSLDDIKGRHHGLFVEDAQKHSPEYRELWAKLNRGEYVAGEFKRVGKGGKEIWISASYNPILDLTGKPFKVVKYSTDVTERKMVTDTLATYLDRIGKGDIPGKLTEAYSGEFDRIRTNLNTCIDNVNALVADVGMLAKAAVDGRLSARADASRHSGGYRKIVEGVNATLDAVIGPLNVAADYVDKIGKGVIPPEITDSYSGDFNVIKGNLNACIDGLGGLREATTITQKMAGNDYTQRVDGNYVGIFAELATGLNGVQERIHHVIGTVQRVSEGNLEDLPEYKKLGRRSEHDELVPALTAMMTKIQTLIADVGMLSQAAVEGKLSTRADAAKHSGDYRKIVEGVNQTLDAVIRPVQEAGSVLKKIAAGDLTAQVTGNYQGEHADIKNDINAMTESLRASMRSIAENANSLSSASEELTATSQQMSANAEETSAQANLVSASAEQVNKNLQTVATGTEEMSASIKEIAKNAHESAKVATGAVRVAEDTTQIVSKLGDSSTEIGQVIKVITSIAQQTNLLALNATIEAARAGEAGKGFAVVANEVKELAKQTAKATEDISRKIEAIQGDTKGAVGAIAQISSVIRQVNDISNTIATAVEEQNATTNEMARNVGEGARGSGEITRNISGVAEAAKSTSHGANDTLQASEALAKMSSELGQLVSRFRIEGEGENWGSKARSAKAGA